MINKIAFGSQYGQALGNAVGKYYVDKSERAEADVNEAAKNYLKAKNSDKAGVDPEDQDFETQLKVTLHDPSFSINGATRRTLERITENVLPGDIIALYVNSRTFPEK